MLNVKMNYLMALEHLRFFQHNLLKPESQVRQQVRRPLADVVPEWRFLPTE